MKPYINKFFVAPDKAWENGACVFNLELMDADEDYCQYIEADMQFRDCSTSVTLEFSTYRPNKKNFSTKRYRRTIQRKRAKMDRLVKGVNEFAKRYYKALDKLEKSLD